MARSTHFRSTRLQITVLDGIGQRADIISSVADTVGAEALTRMVEKINHCRCLFEPSRKRSPERVRRRHIAARQDRRAAVKTIALFLLIALISLAATSAFEAFVERTWSPSITMTSTPSSQHCPQDHATRRSSCADTHSLFQVASTAVRWESNGRQANTIGLTREPSSIDDIPELGPPRF